VVVYFCGWWNIYWFFILVLTIVGSNGAVLILLGAVEGDFLKRLAKVVPLTELVRRSTDMSCSTRLQ